MKIAFFDCFSGISGDMALGALLDCGLSLETLLKELKKIPITNYKITAEKVEKCGICATKISIRVNEQGVVRTWANIENIISKSSLDKKVKDKAREIFLKLAEAEAKIHRKNLDQVHFHEVGAIDSIIDIMGTVIGLNLLDVEKVFASPLATGTGMVKSEHGAIPIPAPATLEILKDVPIYSRGIPAELVTPTGAAIIKSLAKSFGEMPFLRPLAIGYGAGTRDLEIPNVLRLVIGEEVASPEAELDEVIRLETNIDDLNPEFFEFITEKLLEAGALDVWMSPIYMKKNRPGVSLNILCLAKDEKELLDLLFAETSTLGIRVSKETRRILPREVIEVTTGFGKIRVKVGRLGDKITSIAPEYDDCASLARKNKVPIKTIYDEAKQKAKTLLKTED